MLSTDEQGYLSRAWVRIVEVPEEAARDTTAAIDALLEFGEGRARAAFLSADPMAIGLVMLAIGKTRREIHDAFLAVFPRA